MNHAAHTSLEIKSDPGDDGEADLVTKALDDFRATVGDRLAALETKSANDNKIADRLKAVETRLNRPGTSLEVKGGTEAGDIERKAFVSYIRKGVERMATDEAKALTVASGPTAGYLAPVEFGAELLKRLVQFSPIRQYAKVVQIGAPSIIFPRRTSIVTATWVGEIDPRTGSQPSFEQVTLTPHELATYVDVCSPYSMHCHSLPSHTPLRSPPSCLCSFP